MTLTGVTFVAAVLYWTVTALYGTAASQPFVQEQFLGPRLSWSAGFFADWHTVLGLVALLAWLGPRCRPPHAAQALRLAAVAVLWIAAASVMALIGALTPGSAPAAALTAAGGGVGLVLVLALAEVAPMRLAATGRQTGPRFATRPPADRSLADLAACLAAGAAVAVLHAAVAAWLADTRTLLLTDLLQGLRLHLLLGGAIFLGVAAIRSVAALTGRPAALEALLTVAALAGASSLFFALIVLPSVSMRGTGAVVLATALGSALACAATARGLARAEPAGDGVTAAMSALAPRASARAASWVLWLAGLALLATAGAIASRAADWNFVLLRSVVAMTWVLAFAGACVLASRLPSGGATPALALAGLLLAGHAGLRGYGVAAQAADLRSPSARWIAETLEPHVETADVGEVVRLLHAHTAIPRSVTVPPVAIAWSTLGGHPEPPDPPHVFLFVVDSLRRDYLSPYNPAVTFTPAIEALAADSLVFRNAFTQYGATGLSVPSIWIGGPLLHKQYVTPFPPMNTLARLLAHEGYAQWVSMDNILETILPDASRQDPLDRTVWGKDLRLCRTLDEMTARLAARGPTDAPVFAYSLPQDLHVAAIARERGEPVDEGAYDGFYAPVASRVRRLDGCLGTFVAQLKARGLYDRSLIILTSDHGDALGEDGRMGHAYSLHPEIVRVPLIVHVPPAMRQAWHWDEGRAAFTTDLTPTLHQLLGHEPAAPAPFFGESLARRPGARTPRSRDRMVAASYGAVYGALLDDGTRYYVLDAVAMREMAFALGSGPEPGAPLPVTADLRYRGLDVIRDTVEGIGRFYGFTPPGLLPDAASAAPDPSGSHDGPPSP